MNLPEHDKVLDVGEIRPSQEFSASYHAVHRATWGRSVSLYINMASWMDDRALDAERVLNDAAAVMVDKIHPHQVSSLRRVFDHSIMKPDEAAIVDAAAKVDPTDIASYRKSALFFYDAVSDQLPSMRWRLGELNPKQQVMFNEYCDVNVPDPIYLTKQTTAPDKTWAEWLGHPENEEEFRDFLNWHVDHIASMQTDPEALDEIQRQKEAYKTQVVQAIADGWLSTGAVHAIEKVDKIKVYIGDIFDTLMHSRGGYHVSGSTEIIIAAPIDIRRSEIVQVAPLIRNLRTTTKHELNHAVLGRLGARWLNEAVTQHIAASLENGQPEIVNPWERDIVDTIYDCERETLDFLLSKGRETIPASLVTQAYSDSKIPNRALVQLEQALLRSWGHLTSNGNVSILEIVDRHVDAQEKRIREQVKRGNEGKKEYKSLVGITEIEIQKMAMNMTYLKLREDTEDFFSNVYLK